MTTEVLTHLDAQIDSARRLLDLILRQGRSIRERDVDAVIARLSEIQGEMIRRGTLEQERTTLLTHAAMQLGVTPAEVTLERLTVLMDATSAELARERSAELRGLLSEIAREHGQNRALMRQELAFLEHLTRMIGHEPEGAAYGPAAGAPRASRPKVRSAFEARA